MGRQRLPPWCRGGMIGQVAGGTPSAWARIGWCGGQGCGWWDPRLGMARLVGVLGWVGTV